MLHSNHGSTAIAQEDPQPEWDTRVAREVYSMPFNDLLFRAQTVHRQCFDPNRIQLSKLLNIKTGGCPEDCGYCSQSSHHDTGAGSDQAHGSGEDRFRSRQGEGGWSDALLHGGGVEKSQGA